MPRGILFIWNNSVNLETTWMLIMGGQTWIEDQSLDITPSLMGIQWLGRETNSMMGKSSAEARFRVMSQKIWTFIVVHRIGRIEYSPQPGNRTRQTEVERHFTIEKLDSGLICTCVHSKPTCEYSYQGTERQKL